MQSELFRDEWNRAERRRLKRAGSCNRKQTFCAGQPACMRDFVYKSFCLTNGAP